MYARGAMAYDEELAQRIRDLLTDQDGVSEKAMFGGLAFLLDGNMAITASTRGGVMVRVGEADSDDALARPHTKQIVMRGRPMRGWIHVEPEALKTKRQLDGWVRRAVKFTSTLAPKRRARR